MKSNCSLSASRVPKGYQKLKTHRFEGFYNVPKNMKTKVNPESNPWVVHNNNLLKWIWVLGSEHGKALLARRWHGLAVVTISMQKLIFFRSSIFSLRRTRSQTAKTVIAVLSRGVLHPPWSTLQGWAVTTKLMASGMLNQNVCGCDCFSLSCYYFCAVTAYYFWYL